MNIENEYSEPLEKANEYAVRLEDVIQMLAQYQVDCLRIKNYLSKPNLSESERAKLQEIYKTCEQLLEQAERERATLEKTIQELRDTDAAMKIMLQEFEPNQFH